MTAAGVPACGAYRVTLRISKAFGQGAFLGFRRGPDTWSARHWIRDGKQTQVPGRPLEFDEAKRQAEVWLAQLAGSAVRSIKTGTPREVLEAYWPTSGGSRFASERC